MDNMRNEAKLNKIPETVLIVDDNLANLEIAQKILTDANYEVIISTSGEDAIEILKYEHPDLILLDIMMPGLNGFELCNRLKYEERTTDIPIIFLTALTQPEDLVKGFEYGAVDYITKPFSKDVLITRVRNQIELVKKNQIILQQNIHLAKLNNEKNALMEITAHDLKNPLQAVIGSAELLVKRLEKVAVDNNIDLIDNIILSSQKAINIIQDLLEVQALEDGKISINNSTFDARDALIEIVDSYLFAANKKGIILNYDEDEKDCTLLTDRKKLCRVIDNLLSNALKFSISGSEVIVKIKLIDLDIEQQVVQISVQDHGPGFSEEDMTKIFSKFSKLSARPTGEENSTGLGLSIVKKMTELLGGIVELETMPGKGTTFKISFFKFQN